MNKKTKTSIIMSSLAAMLLAGSMIAGATYALFTSESKTNIAVTSGKVDVTALIDEDSIQTKKLGDTDYIDGKEGMYAGQVTISGSDVQLSNLVPGDGIKFNLKITNNSNVIVKYRSIIEALDDTGLFSGLNIQIGDEVLSGTKVKSNYAELLVGSEPIFIPVIIELPEDAGNEYQDKSCKLVCKVEAMQGNGSENVYEATPDTVQSILDGVKGEATVILGEGDYGKLYLRQVLATSTRRSDLDVSTSYPAYYREFKDLTIKAAEGVTVTCEGVEVEAGLHWCSTAPASNHDEMNPNSGFISYLALEDVVIDGINFDGTSNNAILLSDNAGSDQVQGSAILVDGLTIQNCTGVGGGSYHFFQAGSGSNSKDFLATGKKALNNIYLLNNQISKYQQAICFNNSSTILNGLTVKGNTFKENNSTTDNIVQLSNLENRGEFVFADNTVEGINGRFLRMTTAQADTIIRFRNNKLVSSIKYDVDAPEVVKITGITGFKVYETNNDWLDGAFADTAEPTWISNGDTSVLPAGTYSE